MIRELSHNNFKDSISKGLCVVDFTASWCPDCRAVDPMLDILDKEFEGKIDIFKVSFDNETKLKDELHIRKIPTLIFYKNGIEELERLVEPSSIETIRKSFNALLD